MHDAIRTSLTRRALSLLQRLNTPIKIKVVILQALASGFLLTLNFLQRAAQDRSIAPASLQLSQHTQHRAGIDRCARLLIVPVQLDQLRAQLRQLLVGLLLLQLHL